MTLVNSLTLYKRPTLLSLTAPTKSRSCHIQKRPLSRPEGFCTPRQKAAKGGKGEGEGKESPERKTVGRGKGGKCRLLYQFCLFPSLHFPEGVPLWAASQPKAGPGHVAGSRRLRLPRWRLLRSLPHRVRLTLLSLTVPMKGRYFPTYPKRPQCRPNFQIRPRRGHHNSEFRITN
jgi:hypothetical protein